MAEENRRAGQIVGVLVLIPTWLAPIVAFYYLTFIEYFSTYPNKYHVACFHIGACLICAVLPFSISLNLAQKGHAWNGVLTQLVWTAVTIVAVFVFKTIHKQTVEQAKRDEQARLQREHRQRLEEQISLLPSREDFVSQFMADLNAKCEAEHVLPIPDTVTLYSALAADLYAMEILSAVHNTPLSERFLAVPQLLQSFKEPLLNACIEIRRLVDSNDGIFLIPVYDFVAKDTIANVLRVFDLNSDYHKKTVFPSLLAQLRFNRSDISRKQLGIRSYEQGNRVSVPEFEGTPREAAEQYFANTPLLNLFTATIPLAVSGDVRFRHQWVIGLTGSGKTQLLQAQIARDLEAVRRGEASIIVIDSKGMPPDKMLSKLAHLKDFAPGQRLDGKLVLLQPDMSPPGSHETMPPSLAIFDVGQHNTNLTGRDREILEASALDMITSALTDASGPQRDLVEFLVQFCLKIPGATLETLGEILETPPKLFEQKFATPLAKVEPTVSRYLRSAMGPSGHDLTRQALLRRVTAMVRHTTFRRMYEGTRNRFNMEQALDDGKVILINTDLALLKEDACQMFGRYFISLLLQATFQRKSKKPVYCYIDECQDYLKNEERMPQLIDKARDQKVALILAHHRMSQIHNQNVMDALASSAIRFVSPNDKEAPVLSRYVRDTGDILLHLPDYHFAAFIDRMTTRAVPVTATPDVIENMPKMSDEEYDIVCQRMRDLYCAPPANSPPTPPPSTPKPPNEDGGVIH